MTLQIEATDHGRIYVFEVSEQTAGALQADRDLTLAQTFGVLLDGDFVDVVDISALEGMALSSYIHQGYDIPLDRMDRDAIDAVETCAVLIMSRAFGGAAVHLSLGASPRHVATCTDPQSLQPTVPLISEAAEGTLAATPERAPISDAAMSGRIATLALLVLFAVVGLIIWMAS